MFKRLYKIVIMLFVMSFSMHYSSCNAQRYFDEEIFMPVGTYFKMDTHSDVHYAIVDGVAKVVLSERGKEVYLYNK